MASDAACARLSIVRVSSSSAASAALTYLDSSSCNANQYCMQTHRRTEHQHTDNIHARGVRRRTCLRRSTSTRSSSARFGSGTWATYPPVTSSASSPPTPPSMSAAPAAAAPAADVSLIPCARIHSRSARATAAAARKLDDEYKQRLM